MQGAGHMFKVKRIQTKITLLSGTCLIVTGLAMGGYSVYNVRNSARHTTEQHVAAIARGQAADIQNRLEAAFNTTRTLAQTMSGVSDDQINLDLTRESSAGILRTILEQNEQFSGVYSVWEPDAFDGMDIGFTDTEGHDETGRQIPYWRRGEDDQLERKVALNYESDEIDEQTGLRAGEFYIHSREILTDCAVGPYQHPYYDSGESIISIVSPIVNEQTFNGIVGADITLQWLQGAADQLDIYDGRGRMLLVNDRNVIVAATRQRELAGGDITDHQPQLAKWLTEKSGGEMLDYSGDLLWAIVPVQIGRSDSNWMVAVSIPRAVINAEVMAMAWHQMVIVLICVAVGLLALWLFAAGIARPVRQTVNMLKDIAEGEGDLTKRIPVASSDEVGQLANWFNKFVQKVHDIIAQVASTTDEVSLAAQAIDSSSDQMTHSIREQSSLAREVASSVQEMSASVIEVSKKASDAANTAGNAGRQAEDGGKVVDQTIEGINEIAGIVNESAQVISQLGKRGEEIGEVIKVINDIADQTNLLALNAAIEAARAGEHGRGFAVVADEVRKLADRTTQATEGIVDSIKAIQSGTAQAVDRMESGTERVNEGVGLAKQAGQSLSGIVEGANQVATMIQSIAAATEQQSAASEEISRNVESINNASDSNATIANDVSSAANQLSEKAGRLQQVVSQFKIHRD